jgi:uncharacterized membrane protein YedE/YeeE
MSPRAFAFPFSSITTRGAVVVVVSGLLGLLFGAGLLLSGMTRQDKVVGFLDVFSGAWDPSLAFVMVGAIGVHAALWQLIRRRQQPVLAPKFSVPTARGIDARLVLGSALFGVGWGLGGICPAPGLVVATSLSSTLLLFAGGMVLGLVGTELVLRRRNR